MGSDLYIAKDIFEPNVMQGIFDVIEPQNPNALKMQEAFMPMKDFTTDEFIDIFEQNFYGMTPGTSLGADPMQVSIPGFFYRKYSFGYWGEYSQFNSKDLLQVKNPQQPYKADGVTPNLWGEAMMTKALAHQKHRFQTFQEAFVGALIGAGTFYYVADGIDNYFPGPTSSELILDPHYRLTVNAGTVTHGGWTSGGTWATKSLATPVHDINQMLLYMSGTLGLEVTEIWMSRQSAQQLIDADATAQWIESVPDLSKAMLTVESGLTALNKVIGNSLKFVIEDRTYPERMIITTPTQAGSSTSVIVDNDAVLRGDTTPKLMFHTQAGKEVLLTATNATGNTISFTASDLDISMVPGDFITHNRRFMAEDKLIFKTTRTDRQNFASLPVQTSPDDDLSPGVHTYSQETVKMPNWFVTAGTLFRGGCLVHGNGGWTTLDVVP